MDPYGSIEKGVRISEKKGVLCIHMEGRRRKIDKEKYLFI